MLTEDLQYLCELGQQQLIQTEYLAAEATLARAEARAWEIKDFDTLARLYMPLQEARRQRRQRCGEGIICLDILQRSADEPFDPREIVAKFPRGQLLVAGFGSLAPAVEVRRLQIERGLYAETILASVHPAAGSLSIAIQPFAEAQSPRSPETSAAGGIAAGSHTAGPMQDQAIMMNESALPKGAAPATNETRARVMSLWEMVSMPFLKAADAETDPIRKIEGYRKAIRADYACELAHQKLSDVAKTLAKQG
jgi:hypothetical protein